MKLKLLFLILQLCKYNFLHLMQLEHTNRQNTFLFSLSYRNIFKGAYEIPEKYIYIYDGLRYFSRG